jgi:hypothetical protein
MAEESLDVEISETAVLVAPGEQIRVVATATGGEKPYAFRWSRSTGTDVGTEPELVIPSATLADQDTYRLTVTDHGGKHKVTATVEILVNPRRWYSRFAAVAAVSLAVLLLALSFPAVFLAWRSALKTADSRAVVAAMLVTAGLAVTFIAAFLFLVDYRSRLVTATASRREASAQAGGPGRTFSPGEAGTIVEKVTKFTTSFGPLRGAAALVVAGAVAFIAAAWAVTDAPAPTGSTLTPSPSASAEPTP